LLFVLKRKEEMRSRREGWRMRDEDLSTAIRPATVYDSSRASRLSSADDHDDKS
jgi:hypothetical protein